MNKVICLFSFIYFILSATFLFAQNLQDQSGATGRHIGQSVGSMAGGAAGNFVSRGNVAAATAGSEVGRQLGGVVGEQTFRAMTSESNTSDSTESPLETDETQKSSLANEGVKETEVPSSLNFP